MGESGVAQVGKLLFQVAQFPVKPVVFLVADYRPRLDVVEMVVAPNLGGQFRVSRLRLGRCHADYLRPWSRPAQIGNCQNLAARRDSYLIQLSYQPVEGVGVASGSPLFCSAQMDWISEAGSARLYIAISSIIPA